MRRLFLTAITITALFSASAHAESNGQVSVAAYLQQIGPLPGQSLIHRVDQGSCNSNPNTFWCSDMEGYGGTCCSRSERCTWFGQRAACIPGR